jgi:hypothetical protein
MPQAPGRPLGEQNPEGPQSASTRQLPGTQTLGVESVLEARHTQGPPVVQSASVRQVS